MTLARSARITIVAFAAAAVALGAYALMPTDMPDYSSTIHADATWSPGDGHVIITYKDSAQATERVSLEVLGLATTFQKTYESSAFVERVALDGVPANGWRAHPVVFDVSHGELGNIGIKIEIHGQDEPALPAIYSAPR